MAEVKPRIDRPHRKKRIIRQQATVKELEIYVNAT